MNKIWLFWIFNMIASYGRDWIYLSVYSLCKWHIMSNALLSPTLCSHSFVVSLFRSLMTEMKAFMLHVGVTELWSCLIDSSGEGQYLPTGFPIESIINCACLDLTLSLKARCRGQGSLNSVLFMFYPSSLCFLLVLAVSVLQRACRLNMMSSIVGPFFS